MKLKTLMMMSLVIGLLNGCASYKDLETLCYEFDYIYITDKDQINSKKLKQSIIHYNETLRDLCSNQIGFV
jgi:hypothetical protein